MSSPSPKPAISETFLDGGDIALLSRVLHQAGYDQTEEPKLFAHAAARVLSLFKSGVRHETILMAALKNAGDYPSDDPYVKRRFAIHGLPRVDIVRDDLAKA